MAQGLVVPVPVDPPLTPGPVALIWCAGTESERLDLLRTAALRHAKRAPGVARVPARGSQGPSD